MRRTVHVEPASPRAVGADREVAADVRWPWRMQRPFRRLRQRLWFRVPADLAVSDVAGGDAFLLATLFAAMQHADALHVHAPVTAGLPESLGRLRDLWVRRRPDRYRRIGIHADAVVPGAPSAGPPILCFSGGLDSTWSLHQHTRSDRPPDVPRVGAALMLLGADIPYREHGPFELAFEAARRVCASRAVPLLRVVTNLRELGLNWGHAYTAGLAAAMNLFRSRHGSGLVAVGFTREEAELWWPQDLTDPPLVSTPAFPVSGDGYEVDRFQKLEAICDWPEALADLRVCFEPGSWSRNCGHCVKCQLLGLFAWAAPGRPLPCLPRPATIEDLRALFASREGNVLLRLYELWRHARARGIREPWLLEVERFLPARGIPLDPDRVPPRPPA